MKIKNKIKIINLLIFFLTTINSALSQWTDPVEISNSYKGYSRQPSITNFNNKLMIAWRDSYDLSDTIAELFSREYKDGSWSSIQSINNIKSVGDDLDLITDNDGIYQAVWSDRTLEKRPMPIQFPSDIFYSRYESGKWIQPQRIFYYTDTIPLILTGLKILCDSKNKIRTMWDELYWDNFIIRTLGNNIWVDSITSKIICAYFDTAIDDIGIIHISFLAGIPGSSVDINSVFYSYSKDFGKSWSEPVLVSRSGLNPAVEIKIIIDKNGIRHLVWVKEMNSDDITIPDDLYHSYSSDGITWSQPQKINGSLTGFFTKPNLVCDSKNNVHIVFDYRLAMLQPPFYLYYSCFNGNTWSEPAKIFNSDYCRESRLCIDKTDYLHLAFNRVNVALDKSVNVCYSHTLSPVTAIYKIIDKPVNFILNQNYPNPFNPSTTISYCLPTDGKVKLIIFDLLGREISVLEDGYKKAGNYSIQFNASNLSSGTYIYKLEYTLKNEQNILSSQKIMQFVK